MTESNNYNAWNSKAKNMDSSKVDQLQLSHFLQIRVGYKVPKGSFWLVKIVNLAASDWCLSYVLSSSFQTATVPRSVSFNWSNMSCHCLTCMLLIKPWGCCSVTPSSESIHGYFIYVDGRWRGECQNVAVSFSLSSSKGRIWI